MDIIAIIIGIVFLIKRHKVKTMPQDSFPDVPEQDFTKWRQLELHRLNVFLGIVWVWIGLWVVIGVPLFIITRNEGLLLVGWVSLPVLIVAFVASHVTGKEAKQMKEAFIKKSSHASHLPPQQVGQEPKTPDNR